MNPEKDTRPLKDATIPSLFYFLLWINQSQRIYKPQAKTVAYGGLAKASTSNV